MDMPDFSGIGSDDAAILTAARRTVRQLDAALEIAITNHGAFHRDSATLIALAQVIATNYLADKTDK